MRARYESFGQFLRRHASGWIGGSRAAQGRLEAFLNASPLPYCGFSETGAVAYAAEFASAFGLSTITAPEDLFGVLDPHEAKRLRQAYQALRDNGSNFDLAIAGPDGHRFFNLIGRRGRDYERSMAYDVLWLQETTAQHARLTDEQIARARAEREEDLLRHALDLIPLPVWLRGPDLGVARVNRAYADLLDATVGTVVADQKELFVTDLAGRDLAKKALSEGETARTREKAIFQGVRRHFAVAETALESHEGYATLGHALDMTEYHGLEGEMKRQEKAHRGILEQLRTAIGVYDRDTRLVFYNTAYVELWGLSDAWLAGKPSLTEILEKLREERKLPEEADYRKFKQDRLKLFTDLMEPFEDMLYLPDGKVLRRMVSPHPGGGIIVTFEDVTSRLELESSYNTLIAVQRETLDNLDEAVAVFGSDGRIKLWNPSYARMWGLHPENLDSSPSINHLLERKKTYFTDDDWQSVAELLRGLALHREPMKGRLARKDGTLLAYATMPLPDGGVLVTFRDITDTVRVEQALREKNAALEEAEQLKLDFLANVSYQLRTPLNAMTGFAEILGYEYFGSLNEAQKSYVTSILEAGEHFLNLINDILDLSSIEAGYLSLSTEACQPAEILAGVRDLMEPWVRQEELHFHAEIPEDLGTIQADSRRVKQVLMNLIRNAIAHTPPGGTIALSGEGGPDEVRITVRDTGSGIDPEDHERAFKPFERLKEDHKGGMRAGLGLTLVQNIVRLHGGRVDLQSRKNAGTEVTIHMPRTGPADKV